MVVGNVPEAVDLVVAGGGPGGYVAALHAARQGRQVTVVDTQGEQGLGGVCLRTGCIPSKTLIETADLFHRSAQGAVRGIVAAPRFEAARFQEFKSGIVTRLTGGVRQLLEQAGVKVLQGQLSLADSRTAVVNRGAAAAAQFLQYKDLVFATGSSPIGLSQLPFDGEAVVDSSGALAFGALPDTAVIVGGGYIGLEIGTAWAKLGVKGTIVEMADRVLPAMDEEIALVVQRQLTALGVELRCGYQAAGFDGDALQLENEAGESRTVLANQVVVAVGRRPNTAELGLHKIGVRPAENGLLPVAPDRRLAEHVSAIGDITPGPALAHKASAEAEVAIDALCGKRVAFEPLAIPAVVFSDPEVAVAGLGKSAARELGIEIHESSFPLAASGRAATLGEKNGFARIISDPGDGAVLGVQLVGPHASDMIAEAVVAIEMGVSVEDLALCIHPHPTLSEQIAEAAHLALGRPIHIANRP